MVTKEITYTDFDGIERTEDFYFNLTRSEITKWSYDYDGGFEAYLERIVKTKSVRDLIAVVKDFILKSYGRKSPDGRRFEKSEKISNEFFDTNAYDALFMEFVKNPQKFSEFVKAVCPSVTEPEKKD